MSSSILYGPIRAGRAHRNSDSSNTVTSQPTPGEISITENDDGLVHFNWTNRQTRETDLDLIIFPSDATFLSVAQSTSARVHILKFTSSDQRYFFWFQDNFPGAYASYARNINSLLEDPSFDVNYEADAAGREKGSSTGSTSTSGASSSTAPAAVAPGAPDLAALRALVSNLPQTGVDGSSGAPDLSLQDILSPSALLPLFNAASPETLRTIFPTLPTDMHLPPDTDTLRQVVESQPFQAQVRALDRALQTGLVGSLVVGLGLPEEAGLGIRPFLDAIKEQARRNNAVEGAPESMETD